MAQRMFSGSYERLSLAVLLRELVQSHKVLNNNGVKLSAGLYTFDPDFERKVHLWTCHAVTLNCEPLYIFSSS